MDWRYINILLLLLLLLDLCCDTVTFLNRHKEFHTPVVLQITEL